MNKPSTDMIVWLVLVIAFFCAGFALADVLLFSGETMPDFAKPFAGWIVCIPAGIYAATLFTRQNKRPG